PRKAGDRVERRAFVVDVPHDRARDTRPRGYRAPLFAEDEKSGQNEGYAGDEKDYLHRPLAYPPIVKGLSRSTAGAEAGAARAPRAATASADASLPGAAAAASRSSASRREPAPASFRPAAGPRASPRPSFRGAAP